MRLEKNTVIIDTAEYRELNKAVARKEELALDVGILQKKLEDIKYKIASVVADKYLNSVYTNTYTDEEIKELISDDLRLKYGFDSCLECNQFAEEMVNKYRIEEKFKEMNTQKGDEESE